MKTYTRLTAAYQEFLTVGPERSTLITIFRPTGESKVEEFNTHADNPVSVLEHFEKGSLHAQMKNSYQVFAQSEELTSEYQ